MTEKRNLIYSPHSSHHVQSTSAAASVMSEILKETKSDTEADYARVEIPFP